MVFRVGKEPNNIVEQAWPASVCRFVLAQLGALRGPLPSGNK